MSLSQRTHERRTPPAVRWFAWAALMVAWALPSAAQEQPRADAPAPIQDAPAPIPEAPATIPDAPATIHFRVVIGIFVQKGGFYFGQHVTRIAKTMPLLLSGYFGENVVEWGNVMAGSALTTLPTLLLFLPLQTRMTSGLAGIGQAVTEGCEGLAANLRRHLVATIIESPSTIGST